MTRTQSRKPVPTSGRQSIKKAPRKLRTVPGKPFVKGDPRAGRPKGVPNKVTTEAKAACNLIVDDPTYRARLLARMRNGTVPPGVEQMLWYYAKGKPKERVEIGADKSLARLITEAVTGQPSDVDPADD